ncbi:hypothetical protein [Rhizobium leguminosarum]|nr:hypothetical protein [Rhizobium leguminosarum]MBP2446327.1 hypothetical protein [Rhizobium leguminosarum]
MQISQGQAGETTSKRYLVIGRTANGDHRHFDPVAGYLGLGIT